MTTILGFINKDEITIAADTNTTMSCDGADITLPGTEKIIELKSCNLGKILIAPSGSHFGLTIIKNLNLEEAAEVTDLNSLIYKIKCEFETSKTNPIIPDEHGRLLFPGEMLIACKEGLYLVSNDFSTYKVAKTMTIGSGALLTLGILAYINQFDTELTVFALEEVYTVVSSLDPYTSKNFTSKSVNLN